MSKFFGGRSESESSSSEESSSEDEVSHQYWFKYLLSSRNRVFLKGLCHGMKKFFEGPECQIITFLHAPMVFKFFWCLVMEKMDIQVFACCFLEILTNFEDPY
jgi:hypothetical protein